VVDEIALGITAILGGVVNGEPPNRRRGTRAPAGADEAAAGWGQLRRVPAQIRNVSFPVSARGYDRRSVDAYVIRVNRLIAELEATRSPGAALRHALEEAKEQTDGIIQQARERAAEVTHGAWRQAEEISARAKAEAADIVVNADAEADRARVAAEAYVAQAAEEAKEILAGSEKEATERLHRSKKEIAELWEEAEASLRKLRADVEALWQERRALVDDVREIATRLEEAVSTAAARFPSEEPGETVEEALLASAAATERSGGAGDGEPDAHLARGAQGPPGEKREAADSGPTERLPKR
jgi:DivIVA domain-containing protein